MDRLTGKNNDYCFTVCGGERKHIREDCNIYKVCFERQIYERLKHYEDLEESGRLLVLSDRKSRTLLSKALLNSDICPRNLGMEEIDPCTPDTDCEACWEAALKGENNGH